MSAFTDGNAAYVLAESGWVYTLASDCHSWVSKTRYSAVNGTSGGVESPNSRTRRQPYRNSKLVAFSAARAISVPQTRSPRQMHLIAAFLSGSSRLWRLRGGPFVTFRYFSLPCE